MEERTSLLQTLEDNSLTLEDLVRDSIVPACCSGGCMVEPDGVCSHGHPSALEAALMGEEGGF